MKRSFQGSSLMMKRMTGLAVILSVGVAQALPSSKYDDYDQERYERLVEDAGAAVSAADAELSRLENDRAATAGDLQRKEDEIRSWDQRARDLTGGIRAGEVEMRQLSANIPEFRNNIAIGERQVQQLNGQLATVRQNWEQAERAKAPAQARLNQAQAQLGQLQQQLRGIETQRNQAQASADRLEGRAQEVIKRMNEFRQGVVNYNNVVEVRRGEIQQVHARTDLDDATKAKMVSDLENNIRILQESAAFYDQEAKKLEPQVAEAQRLTQEARAQVAQLNGSMGPIQGQINAQQGVVAAAQRDFDGLNTNYQIVDRDLRRIQKEMETAAGILEQNRSGLLTSQQRIRDLQRFINDSQIEIQNIDRSIANMQIQRDTLVRRVATIDNTISGAESRLTAANGRLQDMQYALQRVQRNISDANIEISAIARTHGDADGRREGSEVGAERGNAEGLEKGKAAGLEEAMKQGRADGAATKNDAVALAQGMTQGKAEGLARAIDDAKPFEKIGFDQKESEFLAAKLKDLDLANGFRGLQQSARKSENGDGRYYKPRPSQYPHPRLTGFYTVAYDEAYRTSLSAAYAQNFSSTYTAVFARTVEQWRTDKTKYAEGFKLGNREASLQKGLDDGRAIGYRDNIEKEKVASTARGTAKANAKYAEPILQITGARLLEVSQDGVLAPGEDARVELTLKNFGLKDKIGLRGAMSVNARGISVPSGELALPPIPAQSSVVIRMAQRLTVGSSTSVGTQFAAQFSVKDSASSLMSQSFTGAVQTPIQLAIRTSPRILVPGTAAALEVSVSNVTNKEQTIVVQLGTQTQQVHVAKNTQALQIGSGRSATAKFELMGLEEGLFEETTVDVIATQSTAKVSEPTSLKMVVGRPFQLKSSSQGMLLGSDLSKDEAKALRTRLSLDSYDLRVNGPLSSNSSISGYGQKPVHVVADERGTSTIDSTTARSLMAHLNAGGSVIVWGDVTAIEGLASVSGVGQTREIKVLQAQGADILEGVSISGVNASAHILSLRGNSAPVLGSGNDILGALALTNEFSDQPGRVVTLAIQPSALSAATLTKVTQLIEASGMSFTNKMNVAQKSVDGVRPVLLDMLAEIRSDDARSDVRWMGGDKKKEAKIMKVVKNLLKNQKEIARHYPILRQTVEAMKDTKDKADGMKLLNDEKTGAFGDSLKSVFCDKKYFRAEDKWGYCK